MRTPIAQETRKTLETLSPEDQLLIRCSKAAPDYANRGAVRALLALPLDWEYIMDASIQHAVAPLFYHGLQVDEDREVAAQVPALTLEELRRLYHGNRIRNARLYGVISALAEALDDARVPVLGLKDIQLAQEVYPDRALRPMGDIDLLIHREDYAHAAECLGELGFDPLPSSDIPLTLKYAWGHHFRRASDDVWIDLQWNVVQREWDIYGEGNFDFEIERMWQRARPMPLDKGAILVPSPEDMLFHLCQHLEGHGYSELILFCDIAELIHHYGEQLDWGYIVGLADKYNAHSTCYYVLDLVARLFDVPLPPRLLERLAPEYFEGNLFDPLYDNLTSLHVDLDKLFSAAHPPQETREEFERAARRQAHAAMQAYRSADDLATRSSSFSPDP